MTPIAIPQKSYPSHLLAQNLNNNASVLFRECMYDDAIEMLSEALKKIAKRDILMTSEIQNMIRKRCSCEHCSFQLFLEKKERNEESIDDYDYDQQIHHIHTRSLDKRNKSQNKDPLDTNVNYESDKNDNNTRSNNGFVYRQPFLVHKNCIENMHFMGKTLSVIIIFNLALAHHLKAIDGITSSRDINNDDTNKGLLQKGLKLYELTYQILKTHNDGNDDYDDASTIGPIRLMMIISNNVGEIHRVVGDSEKHKMSLQHLLSAIMLLVDYNISRSDSILNYDTDVLTLLHSNEMAGFYHNVSSIMMSTSHGRNDHIKYYAQAA